MATITYRKTTFTRKPILDIWIAPNVDLKAQTTLLSDLIKRVTAQETNVKLSSVPYVIFRNYELRKLVSSYAGKEQHGRPQPYKLTPKDAVYWSDYKDTAAFKAVAGVFRPRNIKKVEVDTRKKRGYETRFILD
ncbi:hypothetical protein LZ31DRAFT_553160 [Colletotrichum somersetense]|nr:hypothetical protein LZ31DRAFT_553160 [Colletotrichum somersetense]